MIHIGICDDERVELDRLESLIADFFKRKELVYKLSAYQNGDELLSSLDQKYDIVFLDIYMGTNDGLSVAKRIRERDSSCAIIFATNSRAHAIDGYGVRALHYLLKPIAADNLNMALNLALDERSRGGEKSIPVKNRQGCYRVSLDDLVYAESNARVVILHTKSLGDIKYYDRLDNLEVKCGDKRFLRCHKSFLVNLDHVLGIVDEKMRLEDGQDLPISIALSKAKASFASHTAKGL